MTIEDQLQALRTLPLEALFECYREAFGALPLRPPGREKMLALLAAHHAAGPTSSKPGRTPPAIVSAPFPPSPPVGPVVPRRRRDLPPPGAILERSWRGMVIRVQVLEKGFLWNERVFGSLSALARELTGTRWNGKLFFHLVKRQRGPR